MNTTGKPQNVHKSLILMAMYFRFNILRKDGERFSL
jgi:hypothetical protein